MNMDNMYRIVYAMWEQNPEFKQLYSEQKFICLEHYTALMSGATKAMGRGVVPFMRKQRGLPEVILKNFKVMYRIFAKCMIIEMQRVIGAILVIV